MRASAIMLVATLLNGSGAFAESQGTRFGPWRIERDIRRFQVVATDNVMKLLAIRPGMTILDIGAGTGQFAYEFAARLNGTGKVYATDTNSDCVEYMKGEAVRRGLANLHPVLVRRDGVDEFYGKHKYDLITVFHVYMDYEDRIDYFRELRAVLTEGGRLVLILYKIPTPFSPGDFTGDIRGLIDGLSREPGDSPYRRILKDTTRKRIRDPMDAESPEELKRAIAEDFNAFLPDTRFATQIYGGTVPGMEPSYLPGEREYAEWLSYSFRRSGARNRETGIQGVPGRWPFTTMNKLLIVQRYRKFLREDGLFTSGLTPSIRAALEKAGYRLEQEHADLIPFEDMVVYSPR